MGLQWRWLVTGRLRSPPRADLGPPLGQNGRRHRDLITWRRFHLPKGWTDGDLSLCSHLNQRQKDRLLKGPWKAIPVQSRQGRGDSWMGQWPYQDVCWREVQADHFARHGLRCRWRPRNNSAKLNPRF